MKPPKAMGVAISTSRDPPDAAGTADPGTGPALSAVPAPLDVGADSMSSISWMGRIPAIGSLENANVSATAPSNLPSR